MNSEFYQNNPGYSEQLRDTDPRRFQSAPILCGKQAFHGKYIRALAQGASNRVVRATCCPDPAQLDRKLPSAGILDVGCGVGQAVRELAAQGFNAHGVDVSPTSIEMARQHPGAYRVFDGVTLPFPDATFDAVGAFNVLEHVVRPVAFLDELTRVLRPGGRIVVSSPNFLRVLGWRDYHPHMRSLGQKRRNLRTLLQHLQLYREYPQEIVFESMPPIHREPPRPDDDAITATNAVDLRHYLRTRHFTDIQVSCVDRPFPRILEAILDATPLRLAILNSFVTAMKRSGP